MRSSFEAFHDETRPLAMLGERQVRRTQARHGALGAVIAVLAVLALPLLVIVGL